MGHPFSHHPINTLWYVDWMVSTVLGLGHPKKIGVWGFPLRALHWLRVKVYFRGMSRFVPARDSCDGGIEVRACKLACWLAGEGTEMGHGSKRYYCWLWTISPLLEPAPICWPWKQSRILPYIGSALSLLHCLERSPWQQAGGQNRDRSPSVNLLLVCYCGSRESLRELLRMEQRDPGMKSRGWRSKIVTRHPRARGLVGLLFWDWTIF